VSDWKFVNIEDLLDGESKVFVFTRWHFVGARQEEQELMLHFLIQFQHGLPEPLHTQ